MSSYYRSILNTLTVPFTNTKSILLDGVDDYVDTSTNFGVPPIDRYNKDTFTVSVWIKVDASQTVNWQYYTPISATTNGTNVGLVTRKFGNATGHVVYSNPNNGTTQLDDGNWHHLLGVFIASTNNWRVFVDGNSTPEINQTIASWQYFDKNVKIGQQGNQTNYFVGNVDECAYWLSDESANLSTIYNGGVPNDISSLSPVSWWRCGDGDTAPTLTDNGSGSNNGTMVNFSTFSTDVPIELFSRKSIELDGVDDYVDTATIDIGSTNTISFWMKRSTLANGVVLGEVNSFTKYALWLDTGGNINFRLGNNDSGRLRIASSLLSDGNWHHHCFSRVGVAVNYYIDAVLQTNITLNTLNASAGTNSTIQKIGARADLLLPLNASLDEIALFNTNLSASDVTAIYNGGVPNDISSYSPLSWWRCGDGDTSPTLTDNGSGGNNGTMTNFSTFSTNVPT